MTLFGGVAFCICYSYRARVSCLTISIIKSKSQPDCSCSLTKSGYFGSRICPTFHFPNCCSSVKCILRASWFVAAPLKIFWVHLQLPPASGATPPFRLAKPIPKCCSYNLYDKSDAPSPWLDASSPLSKAWHQQQQQPGSLDKFFLFTSGSKRGVKRTAQHKRISQTKEVTGQSARLWEVHNMYYHYHNLVNKAKGEAEEDAHI